MTRTESRAIWPPTASATREAGHKPMSPLKAIRAKCYDCSYFQLNEIRLCEAVNCALWPFRAGKHPWRVEARKPRLLPRIPRSKPPSRTRDCRHADPSPRFRPR
jgi:hypothetical protein